MGIKKSEKPPEISADFTRRLVDKARKRHTLREFLFMLVIGFQNIVGGFFKIETLRKLEDDQEEEKGGQT